MRVLRILVGAVIALVVVVGLLFAVARLGDGPIGVIPGGPLEAGNLVREPVQSWEFAREIETIEMQLEQDDISRTTWIVVDSGEAYIPTSLDFPPGKDWYQRAEQDGDAILRIEGRRYPVTLDRVMAEGRVQTLKQIVTNKYGGGPSGERGVWFFAIRSRGPEADGAG